MKKQGFDSETLDRIRGTKYLWIRAGEGHRFVGIWGVVVANRLFIRSWNVRPGGWHQVFAHEKRGAIRLSKDGVDIAVRAIRTRSERLKVAVDRAYAGKYTTRANLKYVEGFREAFRRETTTELVPA